MKNLLLILLSLLFLNCYKEANSYNQNLSKSYIDIMNDTMFDLRNKVLYKSCCESFENLSEFKVPEKYYNKIEEGNNKYYEIFYYSKIDNKKDVFVGYHDYYTDLILGTYNENGDIIGAKIISTILGDGGDYYYKSSVYSNNELKSNFDLGYTVIGENDTIESFTGVTKIIIDKKGLIHEDTISTKREFTKQN